jgi:cation diffusion facilitator CzcD-associated flavoprotein CzcO
VPDPVLRAKLTPDYRLGCKRVLISNNYYAAFERPNVELVTDPIASIEPTGVRTADGQLHEVDAMIFGTGFRVVDYLAAMQIVGRRGHELSACGTSRFATTWASTSRGFRTCSCSWARTPAPATTR